MADKNEQELKSLREKIFELEDELSVSTRTNIYADDIRKSKRLLLYRYGCLLQIKDLAEIRRKISARIERINNLKSLSARGRILTKREQEAVKKINIDERKREEFVEKYDNKKEIYSDKRLAYYGFDDELCDVFFKHSQDFELYMDVNEKNVFDLKEALDSSHNFKENLSDEEILSLNEERYGDEIVDFELGINLGDFNDKDIKQDVVVEINELSDLASEIEKMEKLDRDEQIKTNVPSKSKISFDIDFNDENQLYNYNNGYNLYNKPMKKIELDSIDKEIEDDISSDNKVVSLISEHLLEEDFIDEDDKEIILDNKIKFTDLDIFDNKNVTEKTLADVKKKIDLKNKLEEYINYRGNDYAREYYNNEIRNRLKLESTDYNELDKKLTLDLYELGILYDIDKKIKRMKDESDGDDEAINILINKLYQINMQYKVFPGFCFDDVNEYKPDKVIASLKEFDNTFNDITEQDIYSSAITYTISADEIKSRLRKMYGLDKTNENQDEENNEIDNLDNENKIEDDEIETL
ncbi:MAG: hypothetical protein MJ245_02895 [Clostridia bacterium]|nr:hypothetical protein [Clostridia bacterium]